MILSSFSFPVSLRRAEKITMTPKVPQQEVKIEFFPKPPPAPTHQPRYTKTNREGPYKPSSAPSPAPQQNPYSGGAESPQSSETSTPSSSQASISQNYQF
jgi:hypothetical protein